jgi:Uma2 family endonuclease
MAEAEIFKPEDHVELLDGEVVEMSPIGPRHAACVDRLARVFFRELGERAIVRVHGAIQLGDSSEPEPDLVLLRDRADFYADQHPMPPDVLLVVEVSDTSLRYDLLRKTPLYVAEGVPEAWVVDLVANVLHVARSGTVQELRAGDAVSLVAFPDIVVDVAALLG